MPAVKVVQNPVQNMSKQLPTQALSKNAYQSVRAFWVMFGEITPKNELETAPDFRQHMYMI